MGTRRWLGLMLAGAGLLAAPGSSRGQVQGLGPPVAGAPADVGGLANALADRVRHLGEDVATELRRDPAAQHLIEDTQEMALAVDEFRATLRGPVDANRAGAAFAGIDRTWQHLRGQLTRPGLGNDGVARAMTRVEELMGALRQALGMNPPPPSYDGNGPAPAGVADVRRLAHALVTRSQALLGAIEAGMAADPNRPALANDATQLVRLADNFHDAIDANQPPAFVAQAFAPVDAVADRIERYVASGRVPPGVQQAWQGVAAVEALIQQGLGTGGPLPGGVVPVVGPVGGGPSPLLGLADQLVGQADAYVATFGTTARHEPEGLAALADGRRLRDAAAAYRQVVARGAPPNQLAYEFRAVDAHWERLIRRAARIARGRNGPYVQQVRAIGETCAQIHQALGMPGPAPTVDGYGYGPVATPYR